MIESSSLELRDLRAGYGDGDVLHSINCRLEAGQLLSLLGPSGCGKSTVLKVIAGLLDPSAGDVLFDEASVLAVPSERRKVAMVFQKPLLFPYLNVSGNIAFGLRMRRIPQADIDRRVGEALEMVRLPGFERRKASELSGGQEQRIALARALVTEPRILLLDEPFSALDAGLRTEMRGLVRELQRRLGITTVFVTHDQQEAVQIADIVAVMIGGRLEQAGKPRAFYEKPASRQVAQFFGWLQVPGSSAMFRPESARIVKCEHATDDGAVTIPVMVADVVDLGTRQLFRVRTEDGAMMDLESANSPALPPGVPAAIRIERSKLVEFE